MRTLLKTVFALLLVVICVLAALSILQNPESAVRVASCALLASLLTVRVWVTA